MWFNILLMEELKWCNNKSKCVWHSRSKNLLHIITDRLRRTLFGCSSILSSRSNDSYSFGGSKYLHLSGHHQIQNHHHPGHHSSHRSLSCWILRLYVLCSSEFGSSWASAASAWSCTSINFIKILSQFDYLFNVYICWRRSITMYNFFLYQPKNSDS